MAYQDVTQDQVMLAFLLKLRTDLSLQESTCYEVEHPDLAPQEITQGDVVITVCPGDGTFPIEEQASVQLAEDSDVIITWFTKIALDRQSRITNLLHDPNRGILPWKRRILKSLLPTTAAAGGNRLLLPTGANFTRGEIFVKSYHRANWDKDKMIGWASLVFGVNFDWDLTSV